jgi:hypothetical protein
MTMSYAAFSSRRAIEPPSRLVSAALLFLVPTLLAAQVPSPKEHFGFNIGDDYRLANYDQLTEYWRKLAAASPRMKLVSIGKTAEGRDQWMMIVSAPANLAKLDQYRSIAARLARAEGLTDEQARALAAEGKAVVWIDGGLHATEVLGSHQLIEHLWQMASRNDPETLRMLDDVIQVVVHANPMACSWWPTGTCAGRMKPAVPPPSCPGCTRNTSGTTTIATST